MNRLQFENNIKDYPLVFLKSKTAKVEHSKLHSFVDVYNELFGHYARPPSMAEYTQYYFKVAGIEYDEGIDARARRAYASIVREHHARLLLAEYFDEVKYDPAQDKRNGIDATVVVDGVDYHIHLMLDTYRSNVFRNQKQTKHEFGNHIELKLKMDEAVRCGDFCLYGDKQVQELYEEIRKLNTKTLSIELPWSDSYDESKLKTAVMSALKADKKLASEITINQTGGL